jgi:hypothetical protein
MPNAPLRLADHSDELQHKRRPGGSQQRKRKLTGRISETFASLQVYAALIRGGEPLTARDLMGQTRLKDGTLYPLLQKRIKAHLLEDSERDGLSLFSLTPEGYQHAKELLFRLEINGADWAKAEARYARSER